MGAYWPLSPYNNKTSVSGVLVELARVIKRPEYLEEGRGCSVEVASDAVEAVEDSARELLGVRRREYICQG